MPSLNLAHYIHDAIKKIIILFEYINLFRCVFHIFARQIHIIHVKPGREEDLPLRCATLCNPSCWIASHSSPARANHPLTQLSKSIAHHRSKTHPAISVASCTNLTHNFIAIFMLGEAYHTVDGGQHALALRVCGRDDCKKWSHLPWSEGPPAMTPRDLFKMSV